MDGVALGIGKATARGYKRRVKSRGKVGEEQERLGVLLPDGGYTGKDVARRYPGKAVARRHKGPHVERPNTLREKVLVAVHGSTRTWGL